VTIFIDNRGKGEKELYDLLKEKHLAVERRYMESGDIVFGEEGNQVGIERKRIDDLLSSVTGGERHFWEQVEVLKNTYKTPLVIIEGRIDYSDRMIAGILFSLILGWKVPYIPTYNLYETDDVVERLFTRYDVNRASGYPPPAVRKEDKPEKIRWAMLQCIRDIGSVKASLLIKELSNFGSNAYHPEYLKRVANKVKLNKKTKERFLNFFGAS